jgi:RNase H-fold protein (predicted Holliday junction resolvase)
MKKSRRQEKGAMDKVAAAIILQRFLDEEASGNRPGFPGFPG